VKIFLRFTKRAGRLYRSAMMIIRPQQMAVLARDHEQRQRRRWVTRLRAERPAETAPHDDAALLSLLELAHQRAPRYQLFFPADIELLACVLLRLGRDFDHDPKISGQLRRFGRSAAEKLAPFLDGSG
jgi:hypothetical protein